MPRARLNDQPPRRMPKVVADYVRHWESERLNDEETSLARSLLRKMGHPPQTITRAGTLLTTMADLIAFLHSSGTKLRATSTPTDVLGDIPMAMWEQHLRQETMTGQLTPASKRTMVSRMVAFASDLGVDSTRVTSGGHAPRSGLSTEPMSDSAFSAWLRIADLQPPVLAARFRGLLLCCRGAGATSSDIRYVRGTDIHQRRDGCVAIDFKGRNARTGVVLDRFAHELLKVSHRFRERPRRRCVAAPREPGQ